MVGITAASSASNDVQDPVRTYWRADVVMTEAAARLRDPASILEPYASSPIDLTLLVSCYNEAEFIVQTLDTLCEAVKEVALSCEIIVIDDGSKDNSRELVAGYIASHPTENIILRKNKNNRGLAQNYLDGAFLGHGRYYRLIVGDNSEPKDTIVTILKAIGEADCIVPYAYSVRGRGVGRLIISKMYPLLINAITGNRLRYYNGLAVHLRHNVMRWHSNTTGFGFQAEILCLLLDQGFTYKEIPVAVEEKRFGRSNAVTIRNILSVLHTIIEIANRRLSRLLYSSR
jgi:dolichol-phosphate mannosyltransferase